MVTHHVLWMFASAMLSVGFSLAQANTCPAIVEAALNAVDEFCQETGRNQACYGNIALVATPRDGVSEFRFEQVGDIVNVSDIRSIQLEGMKEAEGIWGVALMRLQANLPDTFPGQGVTFLLFGDVSVEDVSQEGQNPMQAFILKTGLGDAPCQEAPASGLIVQTPEGAGQVAVTVNGVDISMGSTVLFRSQPGKEFTVSTLEGAAVMVIDSVAYAVPEGSWLRTPVDEALNVLQAPNLPAAYKSEVLSALPVRALDRQIEVREPLNEATLQLVHSKLKAGLMPCGEEGLPKCDRFPSPDDVMAQGWRLAIEQDFGRLLPPLPRVPEVPNPPFMPRMPEVPGLPSMTVTPGASFPNVPDTSIMPGSFVPGKQFNDQPPAIIDNRPCIYPPGPNDPPLPADETRPFCPPSGPQGQASPPPRPPASNFASPTPNNGD
ncbi:MAG: hypothetical protein NZ750_13925 [Anaerolineae bacterium]|nr:hypothetical protein [Anaerolineae bacterium]MDW8171714.1 hypothetical protein [Anaerolineae bacterium]